MGLRVWGIGVFRALLLVTLLCGTAVADPITHQLIVNPIQVSNDDGTNSSNPSLELFEAETDKIWAQAGIDIVFLDWKFWNSTDAQVISATSELLQAGNQAIAGVTNMWFIDTYVGAFGAANEAGNRVAIADDVFSFAGGLGRRDTIAHEIGHILGLPHYGPADADNLMTTGGSRTAATSIADITPDGAMLDLLTADQIATALSSPYLVEVEPIPEPGSIALVAVGAVVIVGARRRRKRAA